MPDWATFAGFAGVVSVFLLLLARASQSTVTGEAHPSPDSRRTGVAPDSIDPGVVSGDTDRPDTPEIDADAADDVDDTERGRASVGAPGSERWREQLAPQPQLSTAALLANVALSQGTFAVLLLAGAWLTEIPAWAFGVSAATVTPAALGIGTAVGVGLYVANEAGAAVGKRVGVHASEELREALTPDTVRQWAVLLLVVLPIIAGFEELLFRGALVGVLSAGFGVSPWLLAGLSSVAFALGHGAQGPTGIVVTGVLGFALAAAYVLTGSLLVVVVAHYLVNALEFLVHADVEAGPWG